MKEPGTHVAARVLVAVGVPALLVSLPLPASAATDITSAIRSNRNVTLNGDAEVRLSGGTVTYGGVIRGQGTLTITGTGRLVLTKDSDFTLPPARQRQVWRTSGGNHPLTEVRDPDPPAITVGRGTTLQYGSGSGPAGVIGHFTARPGLELNTLNIKVDGTLDVAVHRSLHPGVISGSGLVTARRFTWPGLRLAGSHPFTGVVFNGTAADFASPDFTTSLPRVRTILNQGSWIMDAPIGQRTVLGADLYSRNWGNDINFHSRPGGLVVMTGVYSWADSGPDTDPSLSDPSLNFKVVPHKDNKRGINIEGANVQWGDGTGHRFFLPGNKDTVYINLHARRWRSTLTFDYNGPVTLGAPISGGTFHDTLAAPGQGDVVIKGTPGNAVTFAAVQNYDGSTTIGRRASLTLGSADGDAGLRGGGPVINHGSLILANTKSRLPLTNIKGTGSLKQAGKATTILKGTIAYTGTTTISTGTLALVKGTLKRSKAVSLTGPSAKLDLSRAQDQTIRDLSGVATSQVSLGAHTLTVATTRPGTFAGALTGPRSGLVKTGPGILTMSGVNEGSRWKASRGELRLNGSTTASVAVLPGASLSGDGVSGTITNAGTVHSGLRVKGSFTQARKGTLLAEAKPLTVSGTVTAGGRLAVGTARPETLTVVNNQGGEKVAGTFAGLGEGAKIPGTAYRITYRGGDGNDIVLSGGRTAQKETEDGSGAVDLETQDRLLGTGPMIGAAAVTLAILAALVWKRRSRNG